MAVDSYIERMAAAGLHYMPMIPIPVGDITVNDRKMVAGVYPISAAPFGGIRGIISVLQTRTILRIKDNL